MKGEIPNQNFILGFDDPSWRRKLIYAISTHINEMFASKLNNEENIYGNHIFFNAKDSRLFQKAVF